MKCKSRVLKRFPDAKPVVVTRAYNGLPHHVAIYANGSRIDMYDDVIQQGHTAAWRSAHFWMLRNPEASA